MSSSEYCTYPDGTSTQQQMNATTLCVDILHQVHAELQYQIQQGFIDVHEQLTELQLRPPTTQAISTRDFLQCAWAHDKTLAFLAVYIFKLCTCTLRACLYVHMY